MGSTSAKTTTCSFSTGATLASQFMYSPPSGPTNSSIKSKTRMRKLLLPRCFALAQLLTAQLSMDSRYKTLPLFGWRTKGLTSRRDPNLSRLGPGLDKTPKATRLNRRQIVLLLKKIIIVTTRCRHFAQICTSVGRLRASYNFCYTAAVSYSVIDSICWGPR